MAPGLRDEPMIDALRGVPLLADLTDGELHWLADHVEDLRFDAGDVLARPGDPAEHLLILLEGELQARREGAELNGSVYIASAGEISGLLPQSRMTAYTRTEDRLQALRAGYDMHVPKPVELAELVAVAASVTRRNT